MTPSQDIEQFRAGFEAWARKEGYDEKEIAMGCHGSYAVLSLRKSWHAWLAAKLESGSGSSTSTSQAAARNEALEEAARACEALGDHDEEGPDGRRRNFEPSRDDCAEAIRNLKGKTAPGDALDAARYRAIRELMQSAKGSASIEVNQHLAYYDTCEPGEEVKLQWYPDTPIGSYTIEASTFDEMADAAIATSTSKGMA